MKQNVLTKACLVLFFIFSLFTSSLQAQHFEWAKGYSSSQEGNRIVGQVTDSLGNLYILGQFRNTAAWDGGSHLLPIAPYGPNTDVNNVLIAKITPDGTMAWKKVIHANNGWGGNAYDIKPVGDTAFACLVAFPLPDSGQNYCYYLDTFLTTTCDYPIPNGNMYYSNRMALITFDFDGHVLEQHFFMLTFLDNDGNDLVYHIFNTDYYIDKGDFDQSSFDIDHNGNVYICRVGGDLVDQTYATWRGNVGGIKYWVDGRVVGQSEVRNSPLIWYPQLLKFSPHMDSLLASRYLVQRCDTNIDYQTDNIYMKLDRDGNPYVVGEWSISGENNGNTILIDTVQNIFLFHTNANHRIPFLIKINPLLEVKWCVSVEDSVIHPEMGFSNNGFHDICFDSDSGLFFVSASTGRGVLSDTVNFYSILRCQGVLLHGLRNDGFIMCFKEQDSYPVLKSYCRVPAKMASSFISNSYGNLASKNNYIFTQARYYGGIRFPEQNVILPSYGDCSLALTIFDYMCNIIDGENYMSLSQNNRPGPISVYDSILYLSNYLVSDATFGDIYVPAQGYNACVAKYVDTAFMTPYVPPTVHIGQADATTLRLYPNPAHGTVRIDTDGEPVRSAAILTVYGQRTPLQVDGDRMELTGCPAGVYILEITTNNRKYHQKIIVL